MDAQSTETIKTLWLALGVLVASNFGTLLKIIFDHFSKKKLKEESELKSKQMDHEATLQRFTKALERNTEVLNKLEKDLQRLFTAVKLLAGTKWTKISKVIQEEIPRN